MLIEYLDISVERDVYVVGDIHGEYIKLIEKLKEIGFNFGEDLLIAVGDLVDRGPENFECVDLISQPWFKTVLGNHEQFCIEGKDDYRMSFYHKMDNNGGAWFYQLPEQTQEQVVEKFKTLPVMLELKYGSKKYGFVHANLPYHCWELTKESLLKGDVIDERSVKDHLIWGRDIITAMKPIQVALIDEVYFGHTPLKQVVKLGNCNFIDTGAVFGGEFTIIKLEKEVEK